jgi:hypothetical protein
MLTSRFRIQLAIPFMLWTAVVVACGLVVTWRGMSEILGTRARDEVLRRGSLVGEGVARLAVDALILSDDVTLDLVAGAALNDDPNIRYVAIEDEQGMERANRGVWQEGREAGQESPQEILEARVPVALGGEQIGLVRVGLSTEQIGAAKEQARSALVGPLTIGWAALSLLGIIGLAFLVGGIAAKAVGEVRSAMESEKVGMISESIAELRAEEEACRARVDELKSEESVLSKKVAGDKSTLEQTKKQMAEAEKREKQVKAQQERLSQETEAKSKEYQALVAKVEESKKQVEELSLRLEDERHHQEVLLRRRAGLKESIERLTQEYDVKAGRTARADAGATRTPGEEKRTDSTQGEKTEAASPSANDLFKAFKKESKLRRQ